MISITTPNIKAKKLQAVADALVVHVDHHAGIAHLDFVRREARIRHDRELEWPTVRNRFARAALCQWVVVTAACHQQDGRRQC